MCVYGWIIIVRLFWAELTWVICFFPSFGLVMNCAIQSRENQNVRVACGEVDLFVRPFAAAEDS